MPGKMFKSRLGNINEKNVLLSILSILSTNSEAPFGKTILQNKYFVT
jgi:hypothetical protein